jgi:hypothetical protein
MASQPADPSSLSQKGSVYFHELAVAADQEKQQVLRLRSAQEMTVLYEKSMTQESGTSLPTPMPVRNFDRSFGWWRWERRQPGHGEQKLVRGVVEVQVGVDGTVGGGEKDGGVARVVDGDIGFEAGAAARLFDDVRGIVGGQDVNPAETDAGWFAGVLESLLADEMRRKDVDVLRSRVAPGLEQVLEPDRHIGRGGVEAGASGGGLGEGAGSFIAGADKELAALRSVGEERGVAHVKRVESPLRKKGCVWLMCGGLEGVAEEVEGDIRVESGGAGSAAETLVRQPAPAGAVVGEGEMRCALWSAAQFSREAGRVRRQIGERDGLDAFGHNRVGWGEALKRIVEAHGLVRDEFDEDVGGKDFCKRTEPQQRVLRGKLMGVGCGLAVSVEKDLIAANDDENHTSGAGLKEEICAERTSGLKIRLRWLRLLRQGRDEGQHEQESEECARKVSVAHFCFQIAGYKIMRFSEDRNMLLRRCVAG